MFKFFTLTYCRFGVVVKFREIMCFMFSEGHIIL